MAKPTRGQAGHDGRRTQATGTISKLSRDFGFLRDSAGRTRFFHRTAVVGGEFESLSMGQTVQFEPQNLPKGLRALNVQPASRTKASQPRNTPAPAQSRSKPSIPLQQQLTLLRQQHAQALVKLQERHQRTVASLQRQHDHALTAAKPERQPRHERRHAQALARLQEKHDMAVARLKDDQEWELAARRGERKPKWWELAEYLTRKDAQEDATASNPSPYSGKTVWSAMSERTSIRIVQGGGIETSRRKH